MAPFSLFQVYDIADYLEMHPGGHKLLKDKLGRDCTRDFYESHGGVNLQIEGQFEVFRVGNLQQPALMDSESQELWTAWVELLDLVVEVRSMAESTANQPEIETGSAAADRCCPHPSCRREGRRWAGTAA